MPLEQACGHPRPMSESPVSAPGPLAPVLPAPAPLAAPERQACTAPADPDRSFPDPRPGGRSVPQDDSRRDPWQRLKGGGVWRVPLPELALARDRLLLRLLGALACRQVRSFDGLARLLPAADPYVLAANHSSRREAVYLPTLLMLARGGRPVHFLADWNFRLIPGADYVYRRTGAITVLRKPARPAFLNRFRERYRGPLPPLAEARARLAAGAPVALFPEGTVNRRAGRLLRPRPGAVRLALETGAPLIPLGVRFAGLRRDGETLDSGSALELAAGEPLPLARRDPERPAGADEVARLGAELMAAIARLSGKGHAERASKTPVPGA